MVISKDETRLPENFPFQVKRVSLSQEDNVEDSFHYHDFCEITYIEKGNGCYYVNGARYEVGAGDIVIFNQEEPHGWMVEGETMEVTVLIFSPRLIAEQPSYCSEEYIKPILFWGSDFVNLIEAEDKRTDKIHSIMSDILEESEKRENGYTNMIHSDIVRIIILLIRHYENRDPDLQENLSEKRKSIRRLEEALNFINIHFTEMITLDQVAEISYMSPTYFSAYFKKVTNSTFREYLTFLRLNHAQELCVTTDYSMADIAMQCGFNNMSNFYKLYKKYIGPLPRRASDKKGAKNGR